MSILKFFETEPAEAPVVCIFRAEEQQCYDWASTNAARVEVKLRPKQTSLPLIDKAGQVVMTRCMAFQLHATQNVEINPGIKQFPMLASPVRELRCYVFKEWHKGDWDSLLKDEGLDPALRTVVGPSALAKGQKVR